MLPKIFSDNLSLQFNSKILILQRVLQGLRLGLDQQKYLILDELEFSLELFIVQERAVVSNKIRQAKCEQFICETLKKSVFNGIKVTSKESEWDPYKESYLSFKVQSFHVGDITIHRFLPDGLDVYLLFESKREG